jgi:hypothetical protein
LRHHHESLKHEPEAQSPYGEGHPQPILQRRNTEANRTLISERGY